MSAGGARAYWAEGTQWRVVAEGGSLSGWVSKGGYLQGWGRALAVGEVVTCMGIRNGWGSDPVPEAMFTTDDSREAGASFVTVGPQVGMWQAWPVDGLLERIDA